MTAEGNVFSVFAKTLLVMKKMYCHLEDCFTDLEQKQMIVHFYTVNYSSILGGGISTRYPPV